MNEFSLVNIKTSEKLDMNSILISSDLFTHCNYKPKQKVQLWVGKIAYTVTLRPNTLLVDNNSFFMSPILIKKLFLNQGYNYGVKFNQEKIHIGPVIGIMAPKKNGKSRPYGNQTGFFQELMASARKLGQICFAFYFGDIDWNRKIIRGNYYGKNGWQKGIFPIPDVIYPRSKFWGSSTAGSRRKLNKLGVTILNPPMVGKWESYCILNKNQELSPYLPETRKLSSFRTIEIMTNKHHAVYLKPVSGTQGKNIIRVIKNKKLPGYSYQYHNNGSLCKGTVTNLSQLHKHLYPLMGKRSYIIQKEISLIRYEGGIADIRVMVQKNYEGSWKVTGMACRVGKQNSITSNISGGGSAKKVETVLSKTFSNSKYINRILETIVSVSISAAQSLEKHLGNCGEFGVDIGVDRYGKVWFIEANLRPARHVFSLIGESQTRLKSVETPLLYARYLAGF
ncbi:MAG: YheC/YheD family protein [Syntrophomonadaceae bacterium]